MFRTLQTIYTNRERQLAVEEFMDKNNDFENAVEVTSVTTEHPKSKNRIRKRHESKLRKTLRIIKDIPCYEFQRAVCSPSL